ncbi:MAG: YgjP-like metallopeptidase domain-containing protein, partial [Betaproteobacteria bacterium]
MLSVDEHGLTVSAPWRSSEQRIAAVIRDAEAWVLKKLEAWSALPARHQSWANGDRIKYLGRDLTLELTIDNIATLVTLHDHERLQISLADPADANSVRDAVIKWYRRHAQSNFSAR